MDYGCKSRDTPSLQVIRNEPQRASSLASDFILGLLCDSKGRLWVSTDKGLERLQSWRGKHAQFEHISTLLGMPGAALGGNLLEDHAGQIWSEEGVIFSSKTAKTASTLRFEAINKASGMDIGGGWIGSFAKSRDGLLFFGGLQGVAIIKPSNFSAYDYTPPLLATALHINGQSHPLANLVLPSSAHSQTRPALILTPEQRNFAIEFAALDFAEPKKNRYQYRLQDYENSWIDADAEHRSANYGNLPPGNYRLQVRGSNRLGVFSPHELNIPIQILPAWWQTIERAIELARDGHTQTRDLLNALRSAKSTVVAFDLATTLRQDLPRLTVGTAIVLEVAEEGLPEIVRQEVGLALYRIAQESVTNALRHGKANKIEVLLRWENTALTLSVLDDGLGFAPQSQSHVPGIGLIGMRERIATLGGTLEIDSVPGQGTRIRASMPFFND
jgi:hypothetical protein